MSRARNVRGDRHALTRALHPFALIVLFACGPFEQLGHLSPRIFGQEKGVPSLAELDAKLAAARAELAAERGRLESLRAEWEREASELEAKLDDASREIVRAAIERESLRVEREDLTRRLPAIESARRSLVAAVRSALAALATTAEELGLQADETPGLHGFSAELRKIARNLGAPEPDPSSLASVARLAEIADEIHRRGTGVGVREARLLTARGVEEDVELLAVGALSFAYRTRPDGRIGFALSSPADARGFRFSEELSSDARRSIEEAIAALVNDPASREPVLAPIDATGTIAAPALAGDQGLLAMLIAGGPVMIPIGAVALFALVLLLERAWVLGRERASSGSYAQRIILASREGRFDDARALSASRRGVTSRVLLACLESRTRGPKAMEDAIEAQLLRELPRLERGLGGLAVLAGVAPLLGLLGTVTGIIHTFAMIRIHRSTDPSLLAGGISEALVTTAAGLVIAIPVVLLHGALRGRADRLLADAERHAAELLVELSAGTSSKMGSVAET